MSCVRLPLLRTGGRWLNLHEYQAKNLMDKFGAATQLGVTAETPDEAKKGARKLKEAGVKTVVLKAQVLTGGRGKGRLSSGLEGGGIQFATSPCETEKLAKQMIGYSLTTKQTGSTGLIINKLLVTEAVDIAKELYLAIILDRSKGGPVIVASREGGVEIEEVAEKSPERIVTIPVDFLKGLSDANLHNVCEALVPPHTNNADSIKRQIENVVKALYKLFVACDASQVEINPLAITKDGRVLCVDAKLDFDDNASYRQKELFEQRDLSSSCKREIEAEANHLTFITMDGSIGCLVNGAGLAMATMDLIAFHGGSPANFLDLGGGASKDQVKKSLELITGDPRVKSIFVNIFGGITRCDVVARGILDAAAELSIKCPLVVRLVGNSCEEAKHILESGKKKLNIIYCQDLTEASKKACESSRI